jgi:hypothetical protein
MKILLAVDGSPCSDAAVEEVSRRPWPDGSSIKVLTTFGRISARVGFAVGGFSREVFG